LTNVKLLVYMLNNVNMLINACYKLIDVYCNMYHFLKIKVCEPTNKTKLLIKLSSTSNQLYTCSNVQLRRVRTVPLNPLVRPVQRTAESGTVPVNSACAGSCCRRQQQQQWFGQRRATGENLSVINHGDVLNDAFRWGKRRVSSCIFTTWLLPHTVWHPLKSWHKISEEAEKATMGLCMFHTVWLA